MKKYIIIAAIAVVVLAILAGGGFFVYKLYSELNDFREIGSLQEMQNFSQENFDLKKQYKQQSKEIDSAKKAFVKYRKETLNNAEQRVARKVETAKASFESVSGPYVLIAASVQEQLDVCQDSQRLIELELALFQSNDPLTVMQQGNICNTQIERSLVPLFKYQMLRLRASMTGSLGHLRKDADKKFVQARELLERHNISVSSEVEAYTNFTK